MNDAPFNTVSLDANSRGRDIVIGDLHGYYTVLDKLLTMVQFDQAVDRVLSVGDLCDRGPESLRCLKLTQEPWFFSVMGNHEAVIFNDLKFGLTLDLQDRTLRQVFVNHLSTRLRGMGSRWVLADLQLHDFNQARIEELVELLNRPYLLRVEDSEKPFQIVHAELFEAGLYDDVDIDWYMDKGQCSPLMLEKLVWGRSLSEEAEMQDRSNPQPYEKGLRITFCGHNVMDEAIQHRSHVFLDTGCGYVLNPHATLTACIVQENRFVRCGNPDRRLSASTW